jgi:hypothetical protein
MSAGPFVLRRTDASRASLAVQRPRVSCAAYATHYRPQDVPFEQHTLACLLRAELLAASRSPAVVRNAVPRSYHHPTVTTCGIQNQPT